MRIVLNAGHMPGMDPGACGSYSTEAEICRQVMERCAVLLRDSGHEVLSVQSDDLELIVGATEGFRADIFVSIHCNGAVTQAAKGTEVYAMSEGGYQLGLCIHRAIVDCLETVDRGVKDGSRLYVVNQTEATAVLVELAFITNEDDEWLLNQRTEDFASAVTAGIVEYCR